MTPSIAIQITDQDKTGPGRKSAEKGFAGFAKRTEDKAKESGFARVSKQLEGLAKLGKANFSLTNVSGSLSGIAKLGGDVGGSFASAAKSAMGLGAAAEEGLGTVASAGAGAIGVLGGLATAAIGAGIAVYALGGKWAATGAQIGRSADTIGMSVEELQAKQAAAEREGVAPDQTASNLGSIGRTLTDARYGANNTALAAMNQLGLTVSKDKNGNDDVGKFYDDLADVIARQKNPFKQAEIAGIFGASGSLMALRKGSGALKANEADYDSTGAALTTDQVAQSTNVNRKTIALRQRAGAMEKTVGMAAVAGAGFEADVGIAALKGGKNLIQGGKDIIAGAPKAFSDLTHAAATLASKGFNAAETAGAHFGTVIERVIARLESHGWTRDQAIGLAANVSKESGARADAVGDRGAAYGAAQWHKDRQDAFKRWSGHDIKGSTLDEQVDFMNYELTQGSEKKAGARLKGAASPQDAAAIVSRYYERPADTAGEMVSRAQIAARLAARPDRGFAAADPVTPTAPADPAEPAVKLSQSSPAEPVDKAPDAAPARAQVEITLRGAPAGTSTRVSAGPGVDVSAKVVRSMADAG